jgi:hypothetical protein
MNVLGHIAIWKTKGFQGLVRTVNGQIKREAQGVILMLPKGKTKLSVYENPNLYGTAATTGGVERALS